MATFIKKSFVLMLFFSIAIGAFADRGVGKKNKSKALLNITTTSSLRNSIAFNLNSGLSYKGSLLYSQQANGNAMMNSSLVTYQKGNMVYIIPYKRKIVMPEMKQGYTGMKIVLNTHK